MTRDELTKQHWMYYLILEKRFIETICYVELNEEVNYKAFSNTYAMLIQAIGAELDTLFKVYCGFGKTDRKNIADYVKFVDIEERNANSDSQAKRYPFRQQQIHINAYNLTIQPFKGWDSSEPAQSISWWDAFNKVKHNRIDNLLLANQENCLNILGALCLVNMKILKKITEQNGANNSGKMTLEADKVDIFDRHSELFTLKKWTTVIPKEMETIVVLEAIANENKDTNRVFDA